MMAQTRNRSERKTALPVLEKAPTGIRGVDEITGGGLPRGRTTLVTGGPGCGKTLFAAHFILNGIINYDEPGVYLAFEETPDELTTNLSSLGFDINKLVRQGKLLIDHVFIDPSTIEHSGAYDLEALFLRIDSAVKEVGAKRVALDTVEVLFSTLPDAFTIRSEVRRLFQWLKSRNVTSVATGERSEAEVSRHSLEEFVSDCVITLDHRTSGDISTRHIQVVKYRGSTHGTNSYPFLIGQGGLVVSPITSLGLDHVASTERVSTGIPALDGMLNGQGYYRGSSTLVSGAAGTGKSSIAAHFVDAACRRGEKALYFAFEEAQSQIIRNTRSIGINLDAWYQKGLLQFYTERPTSFGLESHLAQMHELIREVEPAVVAVDPISNLLSIGTPAEASSMIRRLVDFLKCKNITAVFTDLSHGAESTAETEIGVSSLMDTWLLIQHVEQNGERNRSLSVLKSRGTAHSNQVRELLITNEGLQLADVFLGPQGVLTGSAKFTEQRRAEIERRDSERGTQLRRDALEKRKAAMESEIAALRAEFEARELEIQQNVHASTRRDDLEQDRAAIALMRSSGGTGKAPAKRRSK